MFAPGIVIYEKTSRWEALLKRHFQPLGVQVRPCRLPAQVLAALQAMPGSVTLIDLSAGTAQGLRLIAQAKLQVPAAEVIVVAPQSLADLEWPAREFGALAFLPESVTEADLGLLCMRQLGLAAGPRAVTV
jgi:DNA-binding NtrC family response regulator